MAGGWADRATLRKGANGRILCRWCDLEVPKGRLTFCSDYCVQELKRLRGAARLKATLDWGAGGGSGRAGGGTARKTLWDADHIVQVVEGGGECDLANIRTLCLKCHRVATADLRRRRKTASGLPAGSAAASDSA